MSADLELMAALRQLIASSELLAQSTARSVGTFGHIRRLGELQASTERARAVLGRYSTVADAPAECALCGAKLSDLTPLVRPNNKE